VLQVGDEYLRFDAGRGVVPAAPRRRRVDRARRARLRDSAWADTAGREARVKRLVPTPFREKPDALMAELVADVARDYAGPVIPGRDLLDLTV
jgi:hypothetical protein